MTVHWKRIVVLASVVAGGCGMSPATGDDVELRESALTFVHFGTWTATHVSPGPEVVNGAYAVRKDNTLWAMAVKGDGFTPTNVYRNTWTSGGGWAATAETLSGFTALKADGQAIGLTSYLGTSNTTDRNTVFAYAGTDGMAHYGQVKSNVTAPPFTFSQHTLPGPAPFLGYVATLDPGRRAALATSGTCTLGGITGTCLYIFVEDTNGFIYYKWVACPTNGNCSAFSTSTTVQSMGTPDPSKWNRIESAGFVGGGLAAAQVASNKLAVIGVDAGGFMVSWNLTASTGVILSSFSWPSPTGPNGGLLPNQTPGATTYNRGSGCAQVVATGAASINEVWSAATCTGSSLTTAWQDIMKPSGGSTGVAMIGETSPASSPIKFNIGVTNGGSIKDVQDW